MPEYFHTVPTGKLLVQRVPVAAESGTSGAYYQQAAMDGSRPGTFFANLRDVSETATWTMKTLAYHEGIPGHHFQISTALGLKNLPMIRQQTLYSAYAEGWALYAERFAAEIGMYKDDPFGDLGRLEAELFRAARLVEIELGDQGFELERPAVERDRNATFERDRDLPRGLRGRSRTVVGIVRRSGPRIFHLAALDRPAPEVC